MSKVKKELAALAAMPPADLRAEWQRVSGTPAPRLPADLMRLGIGYVLQEKAGRGLSAAMRRQLRQPEAEPVRPTPTLRPGTQLVRSWNGRTVSVTVEEEGFLFEGRRYASLSRIAREVTGAAWSGPRFFGLRS